MTTRFIARPVGERPWSTRYRSSTGLSPTYNEALRRDLDLNDQ